MNNSSKRLTAVLPVKLNSEKTAKDLDRICLLLMPSFEKFWIDKEQLEFLVIVSPDEKNIIEKRLKTFTVFNINIVTDDELCPSLKSESGWYKQQILKLAAASVVQTEYYLTLDADNILIKPISYDDLFRDSKPIFHKEIALHHWDWWLASKEVLKNDVSIDEDTSVIGATPEILHKEICIDLLRDIAIRNSISDPAEFLFTISEKYKWTEYTLYWLYIMEKDLVSEKYSQEDLMFYDGIWHSEDSEAEKLRTIRKIFQNSSALFMVPQSTLQVEPEKIKKIIFPSSGINAAFSYSVAAYLNKKKSEVKRIIKNLSLEKDKIMGNHQALVSKPKIYLSDINYGEYSVLSADPPVFYVAHWMNEDLKFIYSMEKIFNYLEERSAYFLYAWCWHIDEPERVQLVRDFEKFHQEKYPKHHFIHLCNTISQLEAFSAAGLNAIFCNHNAFIDENIFKPLPGITKKYDAIYDARFKDYKRHHLAAEIENLALLYEFNPSIDNLYSVEKVKKLCSKATILNNYNSTGYKKLSKEEVNLALNESRVGLCLSRVEGAMYASIQYLLSGIPVVSTKSKGGRDVFFEPDFVMIADDNAHSVAESVKIMIERNPSPEMIRAKTIDKMLQHRKRLIDTVQEMYNREGVNRDFASEWDGLFFNKICKYQKHSEVAAQYKLAGTWKQLGKPGQAEKNYRKIIEISPDSTDAYLLLSNLLVEKKKPNDAIEILRRGVEANPNEAELHKAFINALEDAGELENAFNHYDLVYKGTEKIFTEPDDILCCVVVRNELLRLPYFLSYYRNKGIRKFFIIDNNSTDGTLSYLLNETDLYVWQSKHSFNKANFGSVWFELLLRKFGKGHWCLTLDADELLVYPDYENKGIPELCLELDKKNKKAFSAVLLDMYSDKPIKDTHYQTGQDFLEVCSYFDKKYYHTKYERCGPYKNQTFYFGGVRERLFGDKGSYLLSKIPLLKYDSNFVLAGGQHWTNRPDIEIAEESGCLLHFKFFSTFIDYAKQEAARKEHYGNGFQYNEYVQNISDNNDLILFDKNESVKFLNDKQLVDLGIMKAPKSSNGFSIRDSSIKFPQIQPVPPEVARPLWSVMITVYKRTEYLERALSSVLQQAPGPDEMQIEVIQDGTDEKVRKKIETIIQKVGGSRVCFYPAQKQFGHPHIFNLCIERAHGHWIHILHDDDWIKPGFYSAIQKGIETEPGIGAAFCRIIELKGQGRQWVSSVERETPGVIPYWLERIATMCRIQFSSLVVKREVYEKLGGFYSSANSAFDWDMWKRIAIQYPFWFEPDILVYTTREGFAETDHLIRSGQQIADARKSIELSHSNFPKEFADELTNKAKENYALYALDVAKLQIENHDHQAAIANIREALKCIQPGNDYTK